MLLIIQFEMWADWHWQRDKVFVMLQENVSRKSPVVKLQFYMSVDVLWQPSETFPIALFFQHAAHENLKRSDVELLQRDIPLSITMHINEDSGNERERERKRDHIMTAN